MGVREGGGRVKNGRNRLYVIDEPPHIIAAVHYALYFDDRATRVFDYLRIRVI